MFVLEAPAPLCHASAVQIRLSIFILIFQFCCSTRSRPRPCAPCCPREVAYVPHRYVQRPGTDRRWSIPASFSYVACRKLRCVQLEVTRVPVLVVCMFCALRLSFRFRFVLGGATYIH
ncbi:hypothetical protein BJ912DRAFT_458466 [Pholiota molesta]|nr:hypothetical protein BJ912DRAFT_458466 [Pholiota molesta]